MCEIVQKSFGFGLESIVLFALGGIEFDAVHILLQRRKAEVDKFHFFLPAKADGCHESLK